MQNGEKEYLYTTAYRASLSAENWSDKRVFGALFTSIPYSAIYFARGLSPSDVDSRDFQLERWSEKLKYDP